MKLLIVLCSPFILKNEVRTFSLFCAYIRCITDLCSKCFSCNKPFPEILIKQRAGELKFHWDYITILSSLLWIYVSTSNLIYFFSFFLCGRLVTLGYCTLLSLKKVNTHYWCFNNNKYLTYKLKKIMFLLTVWNFVIIFVVCYKTKVKVTIELRTRFFFTNINECVICIYCKLLILGGHYKVIG